MTIKECPNCEANTYDYFYGSEIEPASGYCESCGFHYEEHPLYGSTNQQIEEYRKQLTPHPDVALTHTEKNIWRAAAKLRMTDDIVDEDTIDRATHRFYLRDRIHKYLQSLQWKGYLIRCGKGRYYPMYHVFVWPADIVAEYGQRGAQLSDAPLTRAESEHALRLAKEHNLKQENEMNVLKTARKQAGYTQRELAALLNVSYAYISYLENSIKRPNESFVRRFAAATNSDHETLCQALGVIDTRGLRDRARNSPATAALLRRIADCTITDIELEDLVMSDWFRDEWCVAPKKRAVMTAFVK